MVIDTLRRDDDEEDDDVYGGDLSSVRDGESEFQTYRIRSIESTVVIRQLPSLGIAFKLWLPSTTLVELLDNYRRDPSNSPLASTLSSFQSSGSDSSRLNIVELGSGTGIVGIAAAATLGADVTVTDLPDVIENLKFNAEANAETVARSDGRVHVASLRWGEDCDVEVLGQSVDLILASDVVYHEHLYDPLLKTLRLMLLEGNKEAKKRVFLMAHLKRWKKESIFFKKARKLFDVDVIHCDDPQEGSRIGVLVYRFSPKEHTDKKMCCHMLKCTCETVKERHL